MKIATILLCLLLLAGCNDRHKADANTATTAPGVNTIRDLETLPQDCTAYLDANADDPFVSPEVRAKLASDYRKKFFAPWHGMPTMTHEELLKEFRRQAATPGYGENGQWGLRLDRDAAGSGKEATGEPIPVGEDANHELRAITIHNTHLRLLPTIRPRFKAPIGDVANGYPFDTLQESAVWVGTPLLIKAACGSWFYAYGPFASGWMQAQDLAFVDDDFIKSWETNKATFPPGLPAIACPGFDGFPVAQFASGFSQFNAYIGTLLPVAGPADVGVGCLIPTADANGLAATSTGLLLAATSFPNSLTPRSIALTANQMLGQPYGWGGMYEQRDCSSTLRDLFTPFGVWLPRNSGAQAKAGQWIPFEKMTGEQKEKLILEKGRPWRTLIHYPGHIMLYLGQREGRAIILHNFWGLATRDAAGKEGRYVIGRCVITTLQPGIERTDLMPGKGDVRERIDGMTLLKLDASGDETK